MRLNALPQGADWRWLTSLDILRPTGEDSQPGPEGFGPPSENVVVDSEFLLVEGFGRNWTGQSGDSN